MISGLITSNGITTGTIYKIKNIDLINNKYIDKNSVNNELNKFFLNYSKTIKNLYKIIKRYKKFFNNNEESIFEGQIFLLKDKKLINKIKFLIKNNLYSCEYAIYKIINIKINKIKNIKNNYLKSRVSDIKDIYIKLINNIKNNKSNLLNKNIKNNTILASDDILPSYILQLNLKKIVGLISNKGSYYSHSSIIARSLKIPMIINIKNLDNLIKDNDYLILDAINNNLYINPTSIKIKEFNNTIYSDYLKNKILSKKINNNFLKTKDNYKINIYININVKYKIDDIIKSNINGIGIYRTEFLFMNKKQLPTEEYQFLKYKKLALLYKNKIINIRMLDVGGDKNIEYLNHIKENNPFLGLRGIRFLFKNKNILFDQIKAILRASYFGNIRIIFPMISVIEEILIIKKYINKIKNYLYKNNILFNKNIKLGIMLETPSIIISLKNIISEVDFFHIGINDLTQYLLASDRTNINLSYLYNPLYPSVISFLKKTIHFLNKNSKKFYICCEHVNNEKLIILLIGLGVNTISIDASYFFKIRNLISNIYFKNSKKLANKILTQTKLKDVIYLLNQFNN